MKKCSVLFLLLFSLGTLFAQNINFRDTSELAKILCSHVWIWYELNPDSTFSDKVFDSIRFYPNGSWYRSIGDTKDSFYCSSFFYFHESGPLWIFGSTAMASRKNDTATDCIDVHVHFNGYTKLNDWGDEFILVDGDRIKDTYLGRRCGNISGPFIIWGVKNFKFMKPYIWQACRQFKKPNGRAKHLPMKKKDG